MIHFDANGLVSSIIQDGNGLVKGLCYMNREAVEATCEQRRLYRYSRKLGRLIAKGETSGDIQRVIQISLDCDSDALLITVDSNKPFCHTGSHSCFNGQTSIKTNLGTLADHIKSTMTTDSYTGKMQRNPSLALIKVMEEFWEIVAANSPSRVSECSDLLVHLIMFLNGMGISMADIHNELNARRWAPRLSIKGSPTATKEIILGITAPKYTEKTDRFAEEELGIRVIRQAGRSFEVRGEIIDRTKFVKYFGDDENVQLSLFPCKPKDMMYLLASKRLTHVITFETVAKNAPPFYSIIHETVDPTISFSLICRQGTSIEPDQWTSQAKTLIASKYLCQVSRFLEELQMDHQTYHLDKISGSSEGLLINTSTYLLADAIVESGRTLEENHLEIWKMIIPKGQLRIGLYGYRH